jgi:AcrR family transcriptional regulator
VGETRLSREELSERQLRRILDGATRVFARRGYQDSTVDNIVTAADVGVGSFYAQFDGKEECLDKVCERMEAEVGTVLAEALHEGGWAERLCDGLLAVLRLAAENPLSARVVLLEAQTGGPKVLARYGAMIDRIADYLKGGRAASTLDREWPPAFEEATASGLCWLLQARLVRGQLEEVDSLFEEMAEVVVEPYLGPAATRRAVTAAIARAS